RRRARGLRPRHAAGGPLRARRGARQLSLEQDRAAPLLPGGAGAGPCAGRAGGEAALERAQRPAGGCARGVPPCGDAAGEMCIFLDSFSMAEQVETQSLDEVRELQLVILEKLAGCFQEAAKGAWRRLQKESCVFSHLFARPWQSLAEQLRGANFQALAQSIVGKLSSLLSSQLRQGRFTNEVEIELFTANVREDLQTLLQTRLSAEQLTPLQGVWEGCQLLTLPEHLAKDTLEALQKVLRLSPTREKPLEGEVLQQKQLEALRRAG
ncbi:unnamed protein product, partial [Effrenium voratum]